MYFNIILPTFSKTFLSFSPIPKLFKHYSSPMRATYPAHLTLLNLMIRIIFVTPHTKQSSPLSYISSLWEPNVFPTLLFSNTITLCSSLYIADQVSHPSVAYRGGVLGVQTPPKFWRPSKIVPNSTRLWKLLKIAEFRTPTPQDVRKKGSNIPKLPRFAIVLH